MRNRILILFTFTLVTSCACAYFKLTILHTNDMHSKFDPPVRNNRRGESVGGIGRIIHFIQEEKRRMKGSAIYLDGGDMFTGSEWFSVHSWKIAGWFTKRLNADAICIGNHEFDRGLDGLKNYIRKIRRPLLCCNCNISNQPDFKTRIRPAKLLKVRGKKVGVIGYLDKNSRTTYKYFGNITLIDEMLAIDREVRKFKKLKVKIIIVVSHGGYGNDIDVAKRSSDIDIIVGGHSHSLLYSGDDPELKKIAKGPYPTVVKNIRGKDVYVVQAYHDAMFVGKLTALFDEGGVIKNITGSPHLMDKSVTFNYRAKMILRHFKDEVELSKQVVLGKSGLMLNGFNDTCRLHECNIGNMILDSYIYHKAKEYIDQPFWSNVSIAFINSGGIKDGIRPHPENNIITYADLRKALPYTNNLVTMTINGSILQQALEHSISWSKYSHKGEFLQLSGIHVIYDFSKPVGSRVQSVRVRCANCIVPKYEPLYVNKMYNVITTDFLVSGGDKFYMLRGALVEHQKDELLDIDIVMDYIRSSGYVEPTVEERIIVLNDKRDFYSEPD